MGIPAGEEDGKASRLLSAMLLKFKVDRPLIAVVALSAIEVLAPSFTQYSRRLSASRSLKLPANLSVLSQFIPSRSPVTSKVGPTYQGQTKATDSLFYPNYLSIELTQCNDHLLAIDQSVITDRSCVIDEIDLDRHCSGGNGDRIA